jgi:ElaB/YqjD/DUF883 family membrane-anchored ribosome-binding protein
MTDTTNDRGGQSGQGDQGGGSNPLSGLQSAAQQAAQTAQQAAQNAQRQLGERTTQARDWASQQTDVARQTVVERPFVSTGAAFAAGVVFGVLLARR